MKQKIMALATWCLLIGSAQSVSASDCLSDNNTRKSEYANPVYAKNCPDPTIWRGEDGYFYCMHTMGSTPGTLLRSTYLADWQETDIKPISDEEFAKCMQWGDRVWAPDVTVVGSQRMAYLTLYYGLHDASIVALKEVSPFNFLFVSVITRGVDTGIDDTIDPEVVTDEKTGKVWLFFGSMGRMYRVQLNSTGTALAEGAEYEHVAGVHGSTNPDRRKVFEGCYLHYHDGYWYLFCSSGYFGDWTYSTRVGRSKTLEGEFVDRQGRKMTEGYSEAVISSDEGDYFYGPGHNGEIFTDREGNDWILYHCHNKGTDSSSRPLMLQQLVWGKDGWPSVKGGKPVTKAAAPVF